jgi:hypothetical protein
MWLRMGPGSLPLTLSEQAVGPQPLSGRDLLLTCVTRDGVSRHIASAGASEAGWFSSRQVALRETGALEMRHPQREYE